jgi:hypothetical protein
LKALRFSNVGANISSFDTFAKEKQKKTGILFNLLLRY